MEVSGGKVSGQTMFRVQEDWFLGAVEEVSVIGTRDPGQNPNTESNHSSARGEMRGL